MSETIDDLTVEYVEDGITTVKELDKVILTKGAWCTVMYRLQNWNRNKEEYSPVAFSIRRYQKRNGVYTPRSKFNISSEDQARKIVDTLSDWLKDNEAD